MPSSQSLKPLLRSQVEVSIWDTAGQERFQSLAPLYYRDAHAALLVCTASTQCPCIAAQHQGPGCPGHALTQCRASAQVYDITDRESLERVRHWVKELKAMVRC